LIFTERKGFDRACSKTVDVAAYSSWASDFNRSSAPFKSSNRSFSSFSQLPFSFLDTYTYLAAAAAMS